MSDRETTCDYEVGFCKPPKHTQWKPGQSGNPKGRPKAAKPGLIDVEAILDETLTVRKAGATKSMSAFEVTVRQLVKRALNKNDLNAILEFVRLCERHGIMAPLPPPEPCGRVLQVPKSWDWDEWLQMFHEHGPPPWPGDRSGLIDECDVGPIQEEH